jgi:hypothetical protein
MRPDSPPVGTRSRKRWGCKLVWTVSGSSLFFLALLGALAPTRAERRCYAPSHGWYLGVPSRWRLPQ